MSIIIFIKFITALLLGSVIGLERETTISSKEKEVWTLGGVRTFALISFLGAIAGFLYNNEMIIFSAIITGFIFLAILIFYLVTSIKANNTGLTTEISALLTFMIGFLIITNFLSPQIVIAITVVLVLVLSNKMQTKKFVLNLDRAELNSFISFGILALVVLPFLPDVSIYVRNIGNLQNFSVMTRFLDIEIVNPYRLWLIVVLVSGFNLLSYSLRKKFGNKKGLYFSSFLSGHISSTITNQVLTTKSKNEPKSMQLQFGIANIYGFMSSIVNLGILVFVLNFGLFVYLLPLMLVLMGTSLIFVWYWGNLNKKTIKDEIEIPVKETPKLFLKPAIAFALLVTAIKIITQVSFVFFGNEGFAITSAISSLVGISAVIVNIADVASKNITFYYAAFVVLLVNLVNLFGKWIYSCLKGNKEFARLNLVSSLAIVIVSYIFYFIFM